MAPRYNTHAVDEVQSVNALMVHGLAMLRETVDQMYLPEGVTVTAEHCDGYGRARFLIDALETMTEKAGATLEAGWIRTREPAP
ncbi:hypothetical protein BSA145_21345 (plasmid) [Bacillus safensis]|uniref:Uncharacterized protein n=1 Tax=Bacillus safensis TaxID=561879 RepID=A0A1L6ZPI4_BACIA|nr:hypothetical protein [Bacillus safensis]APT48413.1 hypothetical protein BSA145_21345 [Bacillus safensis]